LHWGGFADDPVRAKKYTEDHEWVELSGDGKIGMLPSPAFVGADLSGTMGITAYASKQLGDVVYVELPEVGLEVSKGDPIGAVESVKSASDIMTPVTGKVVDHNKLLEEKPGQVNKSPEGDAWLAKIEIADSTELESLMDSEGYTKFTEEQGDEH
jgi:glycine cleavage system H protein